MAERALRRLVSHLESVAERQSALSMFHPFLSVRVFRLIARESTFPSMLPSVDLRPRGAIPNEGVRAAALAGGRDEGMHKAQEGMEERKRASEITSPPLAISREDAKTRVLETRTNRVIPLSAPRQPCPRHQLSWIMAEELYLSSHEKTDISCTSDITSAADRPN